MPSADGSKVLTFNKDLWRKQPAQESKRGRRPEGQGHWLMKWSALSFCHSAGSEEAVREVKENGNIWETKRTTFELILWR